MTLVRISFQMYLKTLLLLHMALMLAQIIFIGVIFVLVDEEASSIDIQTQNILLILVPVVVILIIIIGRFFYQQQLKKIIQLVDLREKLLKYRIAQILHFAISEAGALACLIAAFLSQNLVFVYGSIGVILYFFSIRPTKNKLEKELRLDYKELQMLSDPHFVVDEREQSDMD